MKISRKYLFSLVNYYDSYFDLYPNYSNEKKKDADYFFNSKKDADRWADIVIGIFKSFPSRIKVYRAIYLKSKDKLRTDMLGESWSFDRNSALEFGTHSNSNYLLSGIVNREDVDWESSIKLFVANSIDMFSVDSENELYIQFPEDVIMDLKIEELSNTP